MVGQTMKQQISCVEQLNDWNLTKAEAKIIRADTFFWNYLVAEKEKFPLPPFYIPHTIEIRFDNILYWKICQFETIYIKDLSSNLNPTLIEWRFDDECALFQTQTRVYINRVSELKIFPDLSQEINNTLAR